VDVEFEGRVIPVVSEEGDIPDFKQRRDWEAFWLIDPLDGTKEFINRNGEFTVNIALIKNNKPYLGMVYLPVTEVLYFGGEASGSFKAIASDQGLEKAGKLPLKIVREKGVLVAAGSRSHRTSLFNDWVQNEAEKRGCDRVEVITAGSSLKFCLAAEGLVDVYPRFGPTMEWDTAAAHAVAAGAGKRCLKPDGGTLEYNKPVMRNDGFIVI
jgi:3'(2'), 5'-bisphosphate nucleotidase